MAGILDNEALLLQGADWVNRLTSGAATEADVEALKCWRAQSSDHARAFHEAVVLRDRLVAAGREGLIVRRPVGATSPVIGRRMVLAGGMAAAAAAVGLVNPPLGLWPSINELMADYRTAKGQQRRLSLAHGLSVEMNTKTSLARLAKPDGLKLIEGEVAVDVQLAGKQDFTLIAEHGAIVARHAQFNARRDAASTCVTCASGVLRVKAGNRNVELAANQQVHYGAGGLGNVVATNAALVTAWRRGLIVLRDVTFAQAVAEINRYRAGAIIIENAALQHQRINTVLHLAQLDHAVALICSATGAHATEIGNIALLS